MSFRVYHAEMVGVGWGDWVAYAQYQKLERRIEELEKNEKEWAKDCGKAYADLSEERADKEQLKAQLAEVEAQLAEIKEAIDEETCDGELYPPQLDGECPCLRCTLQTILEKK